MPALFELRDGRTQLKLQTRKTADHIGFIPDTFLDFEKMAREDSLGLISWVTLVTIPHIPHG